MPLDESDWALGKKPTTASKHGRWLAALFDDVVEPNPREIIHELDNGKRKIENIWLAPASDLLQPYSHPQPLECGELQTAYRELIMEIHSHVDYVICDAPPDCSNLLSWNCLMAADYVLTPVNMETYSAQSVAGVNRKIDEAHRRGNLPLYNGIANAIHCREHVARAPLNWKAMCRLKQPLKNGGWAFHHIAQIQVFVWLVSAKFLATLRSPSAGECGPISRMTDHRSDWASNGVTVFDAFASNSPPIKNSSTS